MEGETNGDVFILTGVSPGQQAKLARIAKGLRQIDVASQAGVTTQEVIRLEKDSYVLPTRRQKILAVLGLVDNDNKSD
jgi:transcriptional regulator with XRE-family HTH domain